MGENLVFKMDENSDASFRGGTPLEESVMHTK